MESDAPTFLSLFSGIGGFDLALTRSGWRCVGQVELDPFCARVLATRFSSVLRHGDIRTWEPCGNSRRRPDESLAQDRRAGWVERERGVGVFVAGRTHAVDLLVGGFPCQDFSVAGKRAGLVGYRGTLFWEIIRIAKEVKPAWGLFENVPGLLSSHRGRDFWAVLQGLRDCWPAVGWRILDSRYFGVPQRRRRVFLVCGPSEAAVASVLFESEGGGGHPAAGGEAGAGVAGTIGVGSSATRLNFDGDYVTATLNSGGNEGGFRTEPGEHLVVHALSAEGADASEDGTGRGTPLIIEMAHRGANQTGVRSGSSYPVSATQAVLQSAVRRLTPLECERLQAFPDGWTCLCWPLDAYAADPEQAAWDCRCPDGPRYRALGNAVTVSVVHWIAKRLRTANASA